jgi:hypothetical protein
MSVRASNHNFKNTCYHNKSTHHELGEGSEAGQCPQPLLGITTYISNTGLMGRITEPKHVYPLDSLESQNETELAHNWSRT